MPRINEIQLRRGTTTEWAAADPILALGEPGWDDVALVLKIGDGINHWSTLPAAGGGGGASGPAGGALSGTYPNPALSSADLTAIAALATTPFGRGLLTLANLAGLDTLLGLGSAAFVAASTFDAAGAAAAAQAAAIAASQPHNAAVLDALVTNGAPGAEGLAILLAANTAAVLTLLGTGTAALVNTGTGGGNVPTVAQADARYAAFSQRVTSPASSATPIFNTDTCDQVKLYGLAVAVTSMVTNKTGTPVDGQRLMFRIKDNGTARAITWGADYEANGVALPTTTVISKRLTVGFLFDSTSAKWGCVASNQEA